MDYLRQKYVSLNARDQLTELALNPTVPIEHYPVELTAEVTEQWLTSMPMGSRMQFTERLGNCKLRIWSKAFKKLPPQPT